MKKLFLLFLITFVSCGTLTEKIECILNNKKIINSVTKVIESFKTKDIKEILSTAFLAYLSVKDDIKNCFSPEPNLKIEKDPTLGIAYDPKCYDECCKGIVSRDLGEHMCNSICQFKCMVIIRNGIIIKKNN